MEYEYGKENTSNRRDWQGYVRLLYGGCARWSHWPSWRRKAISNFYECYEEEKQFCQTEDKAAPELEFEFIFDIGAFFNYYLINVSAFAEYAGMNASLLRQYACGLKSPTKATIDKIRAAVDNYRKDIAAGLLIDRPVPQYI